MDETNEAANPAAVAARQILRTSLMAVLRLGKRRIAIVEAAKTVDNTSTRPVISPKYNLRKSIFSPLSSPPACPACHRNFIEVLLKIDDMHT
jgi:hypothetical protein